MQMQIAKRQSRNWNARTKSIELKRSAYLRAIYACDIIALNTILLLLFCCANGRNIIVTRRSNMAANTIDTIGAGGRGGLVRA